MRKPGKDEIAVISSTIGQQVKAIDPASSELKELANDIGARGSTFCPATFKDGKRSKENFEQQQLFALDFDNKSPDRKVTLEDIKKRSDQHDLPILFAYETLSSKRQEKFRVVFINDAPITDRKVAEAMQMALGEMFPEADPSCYRDVSRMYFGGKQQLYYDDKTPTINIESTFRNLTHYYKEKYGQNHYRDHIKKFSHDTGIALNQNRMLDVTVSTDETVTPGALMKNENGKNSPNPIIYKNTISHDGEIFPKVYYQIKLMDDTSDPSVTAEVDKNSVVQKQYANHQNYRSNVIPLIHDKCKLYQEYVSGERDMKHDELFGLATNLINADGGITKFKEVMFAHPKWYDSHRKRKWFDDLYYIKQNNYKPLSCESFCPYRNICNHKKNILSTAYMKRGTIERIPGYHEEYVSLEEMQNSTYEAIEDALLSPGYGIYVIRAMTGAGKSFSYLKLMRMYPNIKFLIAVPTNILKNQIYTEAKKDSDTVVRTPSLQEIRDEIPDDVLRQIDEYYNCGSYNKIHPYIREVLKKRHIRALAKYMEQRDRAYNAKGNVITTHRYMLSMDSDKIDQFDVVIVDEDIIFKSVVSNQAEVPTSFLEKLRFRIIDESQLAKKIDALFRGSRLSSCIELEEIDCEELNIADSLKEGMDIPAFCKAKHFIFRKASEDATIKKDTFVFLKPAVFQDAKYIVVSATASKEIYERYFGKDRVEFIECPKAKYMGKLYQYPARSMSRKYEREHPGSIQKIVDLFDIPESNVITYMNQSMGDLHFGNTEGSNSMEGEDILVIGTPNQVTFMYKLGALMLGVEFDEDEEMTPQIVEYNGYRFSIMTFDNEDLRAIHFWMLESELEQAVGRARLLRNSCEVHLFSNFPVSQAIMVNDFDIKDYEPEKK